VNPPGNVRGACAGRAWLGLALASSGLLAYVLLLGVPWVRSTGAPAFLALLVALPLAASALRRERRARTLVPALLSFALALGFAWLFFVVARLPASTTFERLERAPDVELYLPDESGGPRHVDVPVRLSEVAAQGPLLLVFFRGHW
jgi:hypothetical protein